MQLLCKNPECLHTRTSACRILSANGLHAALGNRALHLYARRRAQVHHSSAGERCVGIERRVHTCVHLNGFTDERRRRPEFRCVARKVAHIVAPRHLRAGLEEDCHGKHAHVRSECLGEGHGCDGRARLQDDRRSPIVSGGSERDALHKRQHTADTDPQQPRAARMDCARGLVRRRMVRVEHHQPVHEQEAVTIAVDKRGGRQLVDAAATSGDGRLAGRGNGAIFKQ